MRLEGACPCGAVRYSVNGPARDVIVCHCTACCEAAGGPWAASAARRTDLVVEDESALAWERAPVSEHGASRGTCRTCGACVLWDAPERETVSFGVRTLTVGGGRLVVAAHIWVPESERAALATTGLPVAGGGLPDSVTVRWRDATPATG